MQRVHWDPEWARNAREPYDGRLLGGCAETWLDPRLHRLDGRRRLALEAPSAPSRRFNYVGDVHHLTGTIVRKYLADGDRPAIDLDLAATNQRGVVTTPGTAAPSCCRHATTGRCASPILPGRTSRRHSPRSAKLATSMQGVR